MSLVIWRLYGICVCGLMYVQVYTCTEAGRGHRCPPLCSCRISLKRGLSLNLELNVFQLGWWPACPSTPLISNLSFQCQNYCFLWPCLAFAHAGVWTQVLMYSKSSYTPSHLPSPILLITFIKLTSGVDQFTLPQAKFETNKWIFSLYILCVPEGWHCANRK